MRRALVPALSCALVAGTSFARPLGPSQPKTRTNTDRPSSGLFIENSGESIVLKRFWCQIVALGGGQLGSTNVRDSFSRTDSATVEIPNRLTRGATSATVPMNTDDCVTDERSSGTDTVSVRWILVGSLEPTNEGLRQPTRRR